MGVEILSRNALHVEEGENVRSTGSWNSSWEGSTKKIL